MTATRLLPILIALAFPCAPAHADSSDIPHWYGTIRFSKTLARHTDDPLEFQGRPGKKFSDVKITWSGTLKFLPGDKAVVVARYTHRREVDRREDRMDNCSWKDGKTAYHDYENNLVVERVSVNREDKNKLAFRLKPDGTYKVSVIVNGGKQVDKAQQARVWREFYSECSKPNLHVVDGKSEGWAGMESLTLTHVEGTAKPGATALKGNWKSTDDDGGELSYSWDLTLAEPQLVARARATPASVVRGESVTLDASASTGKIEKYEWQFTPDGDCQMAGQGLALKLTGVSVTFKALCDFTAELAVSNAKASDRTSQPVVVQARKGDAWATKFRSQAGATFTEKIIAEYAFAGKNRCTLDAGEGGSHWIHTTSPNNKTWRDVGYVLAQVQDPGPFKGAWYVQSQSLKIDRQERVNSEILPAGAIYRLNIAKGNQKGMDDWGAQAGAHEAAHSILVKEKLDMLGPDGDPAVRIEKLVGGAGEDPFQTIVDMNVREVDTMLKEASAEDKVAERLRAESRFQRDVSIWFSGSSGDAIKQLGPLWKLGH